MSYLPPHVSVTQILTRASQNLVNSELLPTYVGSLNQVVNNTPISLIYPVTNTTISYLGLKAGAIVNQSSVRITVNNAIVQVSTNTISAGVFTAGSAIVNQTGAFVNTKAGDLLVLPNNGGTYTVQSVTSNDSLVLTTPTSYAPTTGSYTIQRLIPSVNADFGTAVYNSGSFTITQLQYSGMDILSGSASLSYVALRKDLTGFYSVTNYDQLVADMDIEPESGIGFYLGQIALAANGGTTVLAYITPDNTLASFNKAWSELAVRPDVYFVVPISTDPTINAGAASHAIAMADPDIAYFRMAIVNAPITLNKTLVSNDSFTKA
jgi:hypothetical protein